MGLLSPIKRKIKRKRHLSKIKKENTLLIPKSLKNIKLNIKGKNNCIKILSDNFRSSDVVSVSIEGDNNSICIGKECACCRNLVISIYGDNCSTTIGNHFFLGTLLQITLGQNHPFQGKIQNTHCHIGNNVRIEEATITTYNSNNSISIGDDCLISLKVAFYNTDGHPIYDQLTGKVINYVSDMTICDKCWIGYNATLLKGVYLPKGTIVGWGSIVSKRFSKEYCAIAGNPAKVIKENITWSAGGCPEWVCNERGKAND